MFPSSSHLCICPFYDQALYEEQEAKVLFWNNKNFHNVDLTGNFASVISSSEE